MGAESNMRQRVCNALRILDAYSIENLSGVGTPDINITAGWVELKQEPEWPKREATPLRVPHFTPQQRIWLRRRWQKSGGWGAWMLLRVAGEWFLLDGDKAADHVGNATRAELVQLATRHWPRGLDEKELLACFQRSPPPSVSLSGDGASV